MPRCGAAHALRRLIPLAASAVDPAGSDFPVSGDEVKPEPEVWGIMNRSDQVEL